MPEDNKTKYDKATAKKAVEEFLNQIQPNKFKDTIYNDFEADEIKWYENDEPKYYSFKYTRTINGVPFDNNGISVEYNAVLGKITNFNLDWYNIEFPSLEGAASLDKIYDIFFKDIGFKLQYTSGFINVVDEKGSFINPKTEVKLVYSINYDKSTTLDAFTGALLNYNGTPYKEVKPLEYSDIAGHYAQGEIEVLAQVGIGLEGARSLHHANSPFAK